MDSANFAPRVLIVDDSDENRQVLRAALERRGMQILEAQRATEGLQLAQAEHPDLILLDVDGIERTSEAAPEDLVAAADRCAASLIVLGTMRRPAAEPGEFVRKPYHYAPLIRKIESLLAKAA